MPKAPLPTASPAPQLAELDDVRVVRVSPIASPGLVLEQYPASDAVRSNVKRKRYEIEAILSDDDPFRVLAVVGPCSIHDVDAGREYAKRLAVLAEEVKDDVLIAMRCYFEKPRTTVGWKGLINDPELNGTFNVNLGLAKAREFLMEVNELKLPVACEFLDTITPQYIAELVSWGAIGARTTESQVHRELASGLSVPIGFKNGTSGDVKVAVDACEAASQPHSFLSVTKDGVVAIVTTKGNDMYHLILRGGSGKPNFDAEAVEQARKAMQARKLQPRVVVDCSHANAVTPELKKDYRRQRAALEDIAKQIAGGEGDVKGVMLESHLHGGTQPFTPGVTDPRSLKYGVSITDGCVDFDETVALVRALAQAVRTRRANAASSTAASSENGAKRHKSN